MKLWERAGISHGPRASVPGGSSIDRPVGRFANGGQMPAHFGSWEGTRHRSALPPPHALPFLLVTDRADRAVLVAPWPRPRGGRLAAWQADQVAAARALLARAGRLPRMAWVTPPDAITALLVRPDPSWLARRLHDGHLLAVA